MTYLKQKYSRPVVSKKRFLDAFRNSYGKKAVKPKLIVKGLNLLDACLDVDGSVIPGKTTLMITSNSVADLKLLVGILNSTLAAFYLKEKYPASSYNQGTTFTKDMINALPNPEMKTHDRTKLLSIVDKILETKAANPAAETTALHSEIDRPVCNLYGLTDAEFAIIRRESD